MTPAIEDIAVAVRQRFASGAVRAPSGDVTCTVYDEGCAGCMLVHANVSDEHLATDVEAARKVLLSALGLLSAAVRKDAATKKTTPFDYALWKDWATALPLVNWDAPEPISKVVEPSAATPAAVMQALAQSATAFDGDLAALDRQLLWSWGAAFHHVLRSDSRTPFTMTTVAGIARIDRQTKAVDAVLRLATLDVTPGEATHAPRWDQPPWEAARFACAGEALEGTFRSRVITDPKSKEEWRKFVEGADVDDVEKAPLYFSCSMNA
jgi:hypothetical protein